MPCLALPTEASDLTRLLSKALSQVPIKAVIGRMLQVFGILPICWKKRK